MLCLLRTSVTRGALLSEYSANTVCVDTDDKDYISSILTLRTLRPDTSLIIRLGKLLTYNGRLLPLETSGLSALRIRKLWYGI